MISNIQGPPTNKRKAKCADCRRMLPAGEGIGHEYPMFHGNGQFYYVCPRCNEIREKDEAATLRPGGVMNAND